MAKPQPHKDHSRRYDPDHNRDKPDPENAEPATTNSHPPGSIDSGMERGEGPGMDEYTGEGIRPEARGTGRGGGYVPDLGVDEHEPNASGGYGEPGDRRVEEEGIEVGGYRDGEDAGFIGPDEELGGFEDDVRRDREGA